MNPPNKQQARRKQTHIGSLPGADVLGVVETDAVDDGREVDLDAVDCTWLVVAVARDCNAVFDWLIVALFIRDEDKVGDELRLAEGLTATLRLALLDAECDPLAEFEAEPDREVDELGE